MSRRPHGGRGMTLAEVAAAEGGAIEGGAGTASPPLQSASDRASMRLELLRLAHRHDHEVQQIVERAKALEAYVFDDQPADKF